MCVWFTSFGVLQNSLFSLLCTPHVTGALALTFFKYQTAAPIPNAPATETPVTVPAATIPNISLIIHFKISH